MFNRRDTDASLSILNQRKRDEDYQKMCATVNSARAHQRYLEFEARAESVMKMTQLNRIADGLRRQQKDSLASRRQRLADMLKEDEVVFKQEIDASVESIEQRKERMQKRAYELYERREKARSKKAEDLYYQRFKLGCDDLRLVETKKQKKLVMQTRQEQLRQQRRDWEKQQREKEEFAKMWLDAGRKKQERHLQDVARLDRLNKEQADGLRQQLHYQEAQREAERQRFEREKQDIKAQAEADARLAAQRKAEKDAELARQQEQLLRWNQLRQMQKNLARKKELDNGEELNRLNKEAMEQEQRDAYNKKMQLKQDNENYRAHVRRMKLQEKQYHEELERHIQAEIKRGNDKFDAELKRREDQRQRLMDDVHRDRQQNLMLKEHQRLQAQKKKHLDREAMRQLEQDFKNHQMSQGKEELIRARQIQDDQMKLVAQKQLRKDLEKAAEHIHNRQYMIAADETLQKYIERELSDPEPKPVWHGLTKNNWYS